MTGLGLLAASLVILTGTALAANPSVTGLAFAIGGGLGAAAACVSAIRLFRRSTAAAHAERPFTNP